MYSRKQFSKSDNQYCWNNWAVFIFRLVAIFCFLFVLTLFLNLDFFPTATIFLNFYSEVFLNYLAKTIFGLDENHTFKIMSDSIGFYIHGLFLFLISLFSAIIWQIAIRKPQNYDKQLYWFFAFMRFYLAIVLLNYGLAKLFKWQFFLPEPNTLFTPLGQLSKDILYWSTIGSSRGYNIFLGWLELATACLLLFRKTYLLGALFTCGIMLNVLAVNLSFNISVKLFSAFLLFSGWILLVPNLWSLWQFFVLGNQAAQKKIEINYQNPKAKFTHLILKVVVIILIVGFSLAKFIRTQNFNDDIAKRPKLHGAYSFSSTPTSTIQPTDLKRIFIHRNGYLITQTWADEFKDYKLSYGENSLTILGIFGDSITQFHYKKSDFGNLQLQFDSAIWELEKIELDSLPLLKNDFEWFLD
jgi:hypothetical protein